MKLLRVALTGFILFVTGLVVIHLFKPELLENEFLLFLAFIPVGIGLLLMMLSFAYGLSTREAPLYF